ncbi:MAG: hypothetical protein WBO25_00375 [Acidimicrobiia bacterium]
MQDDSVVEFTDGAGRAGERRPTNDHGDVGSSTADDRCASVIEVRSAHVNKGIESPLRR